MEPEGIPETALGMNFDPFVLRTKKPRSIGAFRLCGAGGDRTLVQTTATNAFYMLRPYFIFDYRPV